MTVPLQGAASGISSGDTAWLLVSTALVMLMVPGLALFYGGLVRSKSSLNTLMMSVAALGVVTVQWVLVGYSLAFSSKSALLGGLHWWGFNGVGLEPNPTYAATVPHVAYATFQAMFAAITIALVSGAVVERLRFRAYLVFVAIWTTVVYDPLAHWVWGEGGWLRNLGALDFAGGTVVHVSAGTSALVAAWMLGQRRGLGRIAFVPHNVPFTVLGAGLLWFGWFGFNAGSALAANGLAASALLATQVAASASLTVWMLIDLTRTGTSTAVGAATGAVVGLVAITPAAGYVTPRAALVIGAIAAIGSYFAIQLRARTSVDDSLDVFACHGVAGIIGALLTGVFATKAVNPAGANGLLAGNPTQVRIQLMAVVATMGLAGGLTLGILGALRVVMPLRVPLDRELFGVDQSEHGEEAYHGADIGDITGRHISLGDSVLIPASDIGGSGSNPRSASA
ncbi:MAG TPA: ammonium transporter [Gemmatimonadaceae bacterium]|nr:ammonium transporter [Gemmatimonadaceae bacterium]